MKDVVCLQCSGSGRTIVQCPVNKPWEYLLDLKTVTQSLIPGMLTPELGAILMKTWNQHVFVGYQTIALMAIKKDERTRGEHYQFALKYRTMAWSLAGQEWAMPTQENAQALYIYCWMNMITALELSHHSTTNKHCATEVSRA